VADEATGSPINPEQSIGTRAVGNAAMLLVARVLSRSIALVTVFATANALGPGGNGRFQATVTYAALSSILIDLGFNTLYTREGARHPDQIPHYSARAPSSPCRRWPCWRWRCASAACSHSSCPPSR